MTSRHRFGGWAINGITVIIVALSHSSSRSSSR